MARWLTFFKERFPLPVLLLISVGIALAGVSFPDGPVMVLHMLIAAKISFLFFGTLRLMDEIKDLEKDKIVHPTRPLPRGLIDVGEFEKVMFLCVGSMVLTTAFVYSIGRYTAGHWYSFTILYLWLMYKEFYIGQALAKSPIIYAITHQIIIFFLNAGAYTLAFPEASAMDAMFKPGLIILGGFFTYEICRKLDPNAHPLLGTYRYVYGLPITGLFSAIMLAIGGFGAYYAYGISWPSFVLWGVEALTILGFVLFAKEKYKLVEGLASLSLLTHIWLPTITNFLRA